MAPVSGSSTMRRRSRHPSSQPDRRAPAPTATARNRAAATAIRQGSRHAVAGTIAGRGLRRDAPRLRVLLEDLALERSDSLGSSPSSRRSAPGPPGTPAAPVPGDRAVQREHELTAEALAERWRSTSASSSPINSSSRPERVGVDPLLDRGQRSSSSRDLRLGERLVHKSARGWPRQSASASRNRSAPAGSSRAFSLVPFSSRHWNTSASSASGLCARTLAVPLRLEPGSGPAPRRRPPRATSGAARRSLQRLRGGRRRAPPRLVDDASCETTSFAREEEGGDSARSWAAEVDAPAALHDLESAEVRNSVPLLTPLLSPCRLLRARPPAHG